jgi:hypothetical protein
MAASTRTWEISQLLTLGAATIVGTALSDALRPPHAHAHLGQHGALAFV